MAGCLYAQFETVAWSNLAYELCGHNLMSFLLYMMSAAVVLLLLRGLQ